MRLFMLALLSLTFSVACKSKKKMASGVNTAIKGDTVKVAETGPVSVPAEGPKSKISVTKPVDSVPAKPIARVITWLDFEAGYKQAVAENKVLLVDAYTDWCYWCKVMDKETFTDTGVVRMLNQYFVMTKFNPEKDKTFVFGDKTMNNVELYKWLGFGKMFGFPTTYFWLNPGKTEERYSLAGFTEPLEFKDVLRRIIAKKKE